MKFYETPVLTVLSVENEDVLTVVSGGAGDANSLMNINLGDH